MQHTDSARGVDLAGGAIARIEGARAAFSPTERQVADAILADPEIVLHSSMAQVAARCGVSDTTVLRMCRAAGLAGFTELKLRLVHDVASPAQLIYDEVAASDSAATVAQKVFAATLQSLHDTLELLDTGAFQAALQLLEGAQRVVLGGVGGSGVVAQAFYQRCCRVGIACDAPQDSQLQVIHAALLGPGDLAIGISFSGATKTIAQMLGKARDAGAATLAITGNIDSPVAALGDVVLRVVSRELRSEQLSGRACQLTLLDALYVAYSMRHIDEVLQLESRVIDAVAGRSY